MIFFCVLSFCLVSIILCIVVEMFVGLGLLRLRCVVWFDWCYLMSCDFVKYVYVLKMNV